MRRARRNRPSGVGEYLASRAGYYVFFVALFVVGVGFGAAAVRALGDAQKSELLNYLEVYLRGLTGGSTQTPPGELWRQAVTSSLRTAALLWAAGPVVIGLLIAPVIVFMRGFVIGFAVGFLTYELGVRGILIAVFAVFPQNLIAVPALMTIAVACASFSVLMLRRRERTRFGTEFAGYTVLIILMMILMVLAASFEAYIAPVLMRLLSGIA